MTVGQRIKYFRKRKGMTQRQLAVAAGLPEHNADVRITQYESGRRTAREALQKALAKALGVSPTAIAPPDMGSAGGVMQILFMMEDEYGMNVYADRSRLRLVFDKQQIDGELGGMLVEWISMRRRMDNGSLTKEEYNNWRYNVPEVMTEERKKDVLI
ncbi:MAG: helix-turn-helix domain-containing protein [Clostridiales bacterium]|nr:helix-turn-helix domain-containing protein [Clostridiales bacterium]